MAVTIRTTQTASSASNGTSLVITKPTGLADGDLMVAMIALSSADTDAFTTPAGWTAIAQQSFDTNQRAAKVFYKKADATDAAAANFTFSFETAFHRVGALMAFSNINTSLDNSKGGTDTDDTPSIAGFTPSNQDFFLIFIASWSSDDNIDVTNDGYAIATDNPSWTELFDTQAKTSGVKTLSIGGAYASRSQVTATGNATATATPATGTIAASALFILGFIESLRVSPDVINANQSSAVLAPTITGGANFSSTTINATGAVNTPQHMGQADWSSQQKSTTGTWTTQSKS